MQAVRRLRGLIRRDSERGTVLVFTAAAMLPIAFMLAFAIDVAHWFDYSRNLQNRADAAALAGGVAYGNFCLAGGTPGDTATGAQSAVGKWAQFFSGAGAPPLTDANLPYRHTDISSFLASQPAPWNTWNLTRDGYVNNTTVEPLRLKMGSLADFHVLLNANNYWEKGGTNFAMGTFCNANPALDATDLDPGPAGPMLDVKLTQYRLGLFVPVIGTRPSINAHARVELQGQLSGDNIRPIAVRDAGFTPCVSVDFVNASTNQVIKTAVLTKQAQANQSAPVVWTNASVELDANGNPVPGTGPASLTIPTANVYVRPFLNNCQGAGQRYDDADNTGLLYINSYPQTDPALVAGNAPALTFGGTPAGGVFLRNTCTPDQYFSSGGCTAEVNAYVKFAPGINAAKTSVSATDYQWNPDPAVRALVPTGAPIKLSSKPATPTLWQGNLSVSDQSGIHLLKIDWEQQDGSVNGVACGNGNGGAPPPCTGSFGFQQQAFGICNGCSGPDDSGPIVKMQLRKSTDAAGTCCQQTLQTGSAQNLVVTLTLAGLSAATPGDPATILRFPVSGNHQTGLVYCGPDYPNGSWGASADQDAIYYGCSPSNPKFDPRLNPLFVNTRNGACGTPWPDGNHQDCVKTQPGSIRTKIVCTIVERITKQPEDPNCATSNVANCPVNHWTAAYNYDVPGGDSRALSFIITSFADLAVDPNAPQLWVPIRRFATFYITGWDSQVKPQCGDNENFPGRNKNNSDNAAIWGHWINYVDVGGAGTGDPCPDPAQPLQNCVAVLTR